MIIGYARVSSRPERWRRDVIFIATLRMDRADLNRAWLGI
jgi:hypothetical protein